MDALTDTQNSEEKLCVLPFSELKIDEAMNCRGTILLSDITDLAEDIRANGHIAPVLARYKHDDETFEEPYVLVAGFSRSKAMRDILKWTEIKTVVRHMSKQQCAVINAAENLKRRDLNIMQEAEAIRRLVRTGMDRSEICKALGMTTGWVQPRMYLLQLPEPIQLMAAAGYLTTENIRNLYSLKDGTEQIMVAKRIKEKKQRNSIAKVEVKAFSQTTDTRKSKAKIARMRSKADIENMQDWLEVIKFPTGIHLGFLAWAGGFINDLEMQARIQSYLMELGRSDFFPDPAGIPNVKEETRIL